MRQLKIARQVTTRDTISLDKYLYEIGKFKLVTAEEEVELTIKIKKGDIVAFGQLIEANLRFVLIFRVKWSPATHTGQNCQ